MSLQSPKLVLLVIALLFFGPVLLAVLMRSDWWDFKPGSFSNRGTLVQPPVMLGLEKLDIQYPETGTGDPGRPKWVVLYPFSGDCGRACRQDVSGLRQVHLATGRNRDRVTVVLLVQQPVSPATLMDLVNIYPEFVIAVDTPGTAATALPELTTDTATGGFGGRRAFLLDPPGNIILAYAPGFDPNHINKDLKRLLTWSVQDDKP